MKNKRQADSQHLSAWAGSWKRERMNGKGHRIHSTGGVCSCEDGRDRPFSETEKYSAVFALSPCKGTDLAAWKRESTGIKRGFVFPVWLKAFWSKQNPEVNSLFKKCIYVYTQTHAHTHVDAFSTARWCQIIHLCQLHCFCRCLGATCLSLFCFSYLDNISNNFSFCLMEINKPGSLIWWYHSMFVLGLTLHF